jgi:hypothetical protein
VRSNTSQLESVTTMSGGELLYEEDLFDTTGSGAADLVAREEITRHPERDAPFPPSQAAIFVKAARRVSDPRRERVYTDRAAPSPTNPPVRYHAMRGDRCGVTKRLAGK